MFFIAYILLVTIQIPTLPAQPTAKAPIRGGARRENTKDLAGLHRLIRIKNSSATLLYIQELLRKKPSLSTEGIFIDKRVHDTKKNIQEYIYRIIIIEESKSLNSLSPEQAELLISFLVSRLPKEIATKIAPSCSNVLWSLAQYLFCCKCCR